MEKKKILAGKAIAALLLASSFTMSADAASNLDLKDVYSARGQCGGSRSGCAATIRSGCAATPTPEQTDQGNAQHQPKQPANGQPMTPKSGCGAQPYRPNQSTAGYGAQSYRPARPSAGCAAASSDNSVVPTNAPTNNQMRRDANQRPQNGGTTSTYQGTSTGPGPNGGYPETPRGTYPIQPGSRH